MMTQDRVREVQGTLMKLRADGISFEPMALRLLRKEMSLADEEIRELKSRLMMEIRGRWFFRPMIVGSEDWKALRERMKEWLDEFGFFSVGSLFAAFSHAFSHIGSPADCIPLLRYCRHDVVDRKGVLLCAGRDGNIDDLLAGTAEDVREWLDEEGGELPLWRLEEDLPHMDSDSLELMRSLHLADVSVTTIGDLPCWSFAGDSLLPEDFSDKLTRAADTLAHVGRPVTIANLAFALDLLYCERFRAERRLEDDRIFLNACRRHYQGDADIFRTARTSRPSPGASGGTGGRRRRSENTRFERLGVPVGAELVMDSRPDVRCVVHDSVNQVEYGGKILTISALAREVRGIKGGNGFEFFSYEGETLWNRRNRLDRMRADGGGGNV